MRTASLLIIGGGIIGHLVAWRACAADPSAKVVLIERDIPGGGASARSAGLHFPLGRTEVVRTMSLRSQRFYEAALQSQPHLPIVPLRLRIHGSEAHEPWLRSILTEGAELKRDPDESQIAESLGSVASIWTARGAHRTDVAALTRNIRVELAGRLCILDGLKVQFIEEGDRVTSVVTQDGTTLAAKQVVLAPGPWALASEFRPFVETLGVRIKKVVAFHLDEQPLENDPCADLFIEADAFLMPRRVGLGRLFSLTRQEWDVSPETVSQGVTEADRSEAEAILERVSPRLRGRLAGGQVFCDAYSTDGVPIVTRVGQSGQIVFAGAANGSGYRLAPAIADAALGALGITHSLEINK